MSTLACALSSSSSVSGLTGFVSFLARKSSMVARGIPRSLSFRALRSYSRTHHHCWRSSSASRPARVARASLALFLRSSLILVFGSSSLAVRVFSSFTVFSRKTRRVSSHLVAASLRWLPP